ncbi:MAG: hypothetical protein SFV52_06480 [Saprospiraceae bacterium]|nr:hypothetical protein [Saprospiraceae bacterium]
MRHPHFSHVDDAQLTTSAYTGDLEDQAPNNDAYDAIGNLTQDTRDSISNISWTNAQKIDTIQKTDRTLRFRYNAMQERVARYSKPNSSHAEKRTYYLRHAQGNTLATSSGWVQNTGSTVTWDSFKLAEQHRYGSSRVGYLQPDVKLYPTAPKNPHLPDTSRCPDFEGKKRCEFYSLTRNRQ